MFLWLIAEHYNLTCQGKVIAADFLSAIELRISFRLALPLTACSMKDGNHHVTRMMPVVIQSFE